VRQLTKVLLVPSFPVTQVALYLASSLSHMFSCEQVLIDLIHDLRQPLGSIGTSAYCLDLSIDPKDSRAQRYLQQIQQQIERADDMLSAACAELARVRDECVEAAVSGR
jgi:signal transduction histidine kinase